jgi:hypothetical protein
MADAIGSKLDFSIHSNRHVTKVTVSLALRVPLFVENEHKEFAMPSIDQPSTKPHHLRIELQWPTIRLGHNDLWALLFAARDDVEVPIAITIVNVYNEGKRTIKWERCSLDAHHSSLTHEVVFEPPPGSMI